MSQHNSFTNTGTNTGPVVFGGTVNGSVRGGDIRRDAEPAALRIASRTEPATEQRSTPAPGKPPRVFITYSHDDEQHRTLVRDFATFLRTRAALDVRLDQWADDGRRDWSLWAIEQLAEADFVLVIASPDYKRRAEGTEEPHLGLGAQFEAAMIRDNLTRDLPRATRRILPVVLPGRRVEEIPSFLNAHSTTHYEITEFTLAGVEELLVAITGLARFSLPEIGT
ncbi:SEFIR domain-containing protein [Amycolatopsis sp. CA-128772]|uniref:SEFIR domain-containing protein n=1 Tax=Amycolatopsis sp. CA-128772 TaxID=2073159 RepID=UPI000CD21800|nr:SEFIR domain-containing protein [Amycolatopsis sp. CA-128772]